MSNQWYFYRYFHFEMSIYSPFLILSLKLLFQKKLEAAEEKGVSFTYEFVTVESRWLDVLLGFLPLILIIGVWLFIMRRMSGGGAGGGGAQIFNIGKYI